MFVRSDTMAVTTMASASAPDDKVCALIRPLVAEWAAAPLDDDAFPRQRVAALRRVGALNAFATVADVSDLLETLRLIGGVDLALGRIYEGHVNAVQLITAYGDAAQKTALASDMAAGRLFGVWNTEPAPGVSLVAIGEQRWRLEGAKTFATGAGELDRALITARDASGAKQMVRVDVGCCPARADNRHWQVRGMRGTLSGTFDFAGLEVGPAALVGGPDDYEREPLFSAGAWRFTVVQLGAIEALLRYWRDHLIAAGKDQDSVQRARFAACAVQTRSAGLWVRRAAVEAEAGGRDCIPLVLMTRGVVEEAALAAMEAAARAVGTASFFSGHPIDRITRDLGLYLRQPAPDQARDRAAAAWIARDGWGEDRWW